MKNVFWIFLLLWVPGPLLTYAQSKPGANFAAQKEVVYRVSSAASLPAAITWYTNFFGRKPKRVNNRAKYPYAIFRIDGITVRLETDPKYVSLKETLFYWMLPTAEEVKTKLKLLREDPANRVTDIRDVGSLSAEQRSGTSKAGGAEVKNVVEFVATDPEGNRIGVINNPIYVPTR